MNKRFIVLLSMINILGFNAEASDSFRYGMYLRSGIGLNSKGGDQECFNNPGTPANEFRLGNECTTYGEMIFAAFPKKPLPDSPMFFKAQVRLAFSQQGFTNWEADENNTILVRESYVEAGGFNGSPITYWAGKRFYRDEANLYMNDFFYFADMSGNGGGIGNIPFWSGALHVAWLRETSSSIQTEHGRRGMNVLDIRLMGKPLTKKSHLQIWTAYAHLPKSLVVETENTKEEELSSQDGKVIAARHEMTVKGGFNHFAMMYGTGLLREFNLYAPLDTVEGSVEAKELKDSKRLRLVEHMTRDVSQRWAYHLSSSFEWRDNGDTKNQETWWNVGVRPVYFFSDHYQLAFEAGTSVVKRSRQASRQLTRLTLAAQVGISRSIWGRPVLRAFISRSFWSRSNKGEVGGLAYKSETSGGNYGLQIEAWF